MLKRLDVIITDKKICQSRTQAQNLIQSGNVKVDGIKITKSSMKFEENVKLDVNLDSLKYVSRGGFKLQTAIKDFALDFNDKEVIDVGCSTGGFTDCALQYGAKKVIGVDVGYNQLNTKLKLNSKVILYENMDIRDFKLNDNEKPTILIGDISFISLTKILYHIAKFESVKDFILLVKPQFECGIKIAKKYKGVINNFEIHKEILNSIWTEFEKYNLIVQNLTVSSILGGDGNIEYLIYAIKNSKKIFDSQSRIDKINQVIENAKKIKMGD